MHILSQKEVLILRQQRVNSFFKKARALIAQSPSNDASAQERKEIEKQIVRCLFHTIRFVQNPLSTEREIREILKYPRASENLKFYVDELFHAGHKYKAIIDSAVRDGMAIRRAVRPPYPKEFGVGGSFYLQVENIRTAFDLVKERIDMMNDSLPGQHTLQLVQNGKIPTLSYFNGRSVQTFRLNAFLMQRAQVLRQLAAGFDSFDLTDEALLDTFKQKNYDAYKTLKSQRMRENATRNKAFFMTLRDEFLFYRLAHELETHPEDSFETNVCRVAQFYEQTKNISLKVTTTGREILPDQMPFKTIMFTRNPYEIATLSTYKEWMRSAKHESFCLSAVGENFKYIKQEIGRGSIVVYGLDQDFIPKCRVILKPYFHESGKVVYRLGRIKGEVTDGFEDQVQTFVTTHFNDPMEAVYHLPKEMHTDDLSTVLWTYRHPTPELILNGLNVPYTKTDDGLIIVSGTLSFAGMGLKELPDLSRVVVDCFDISDNKDLTSLKGMPVCRTLKISQTGIRNLSDMAQGVQEIESGYNVLSSLSGLPSSVWRFSLKKGGVKGGICLADFKACESVCLAMTDLTATKGLSPACRELDISCAPVHVLEDIPDTIRYVRADLCPIEDIERVPPVVLHCVLGLSFDMQEKAYQILARQPQSVQEEAYRRLSDLPAADKEQMMRRFFQWQQRHQRECQYQSEHVRD